MAKGRSRDTLAQRVSTSLDTNGYRSGMTSEAPFIDLLRGLVAVVLGNFPRYGYWDRYFIRAIMYIFIVVALALSFVYYRKRAAEATFLPENVLWIDETQDVVGKWNRLSLASFLMFQWVAFLVPAVCVMILGGFVFWRFC